MPQHKSCGKRMRQAEARNAVNRSVKSAVKTAIKKFQSAEEETLEEAFRNACSQLDRAVRKGAIPRTRADRAKSRLAIQRNKRAA